MKKQKEKKLDFRGVAQWVARSKYYGYPNCCIDEFVSFAVTGCPKRSKKRKFDGSGYVPCEKCEKHMTAEELEMLINLRRVCDYDFPHRE